MLSPVLLVVALLVRVKLGSPVIFRQQRPGKDGRLFTIYKFRTMRDAPARDPAPSTPSPPTPSGSRRSAARCARPRSTSCPSSCNVFVGDMSIVGPRPLLPEYLDALQ